MRCLMAEKELCDNLGVFKQQQLSIKFPLLSEDKAFDVRLEGGAWLRMKSSGIAANVVDMIKGISTA